MDQKFGFFFNFGYKEGELPCLSETSFAQGVLAP